MARPEFTPEQDAEMAEYKRRSAIDNVFHRWINQRQDERWAAGEPRERSLYEWKRAMLERPRLVIWLRQARTGTLPTTHKQCSHSPIEVLAQNRLICARGVDVTECPILKSVYASAIPSYYEDHLTTDDLDVIAAEVCAWHIFTGTIGHEERNDAYWRFDTSEGYVKDEGDRRFWSNVYNSLSGSDADAPLFDALP